MKWGNEGLAQKVTTFIHPGEECPVLQCDVPVCEESEPTECECPACEVAECNCPTQMVTDADVCTKVFDQLDKIEKKLSGTTTEKSEEELFEEFKTWYESKE
jgi:hypothetical protein